MNAPQQNQQSKNTMFVSLPAGVTEHSGLYEQFGILEEFLQKATIEPDTRQRGMLVTLPSTQSDGMVDECLRAWITKLILDSEMQLITDPSERQLQGFVYKWHRYAVVLRVGDELYTNVWPRAGITVEGGKCEFVLSYYERFSMMSDAHS